MCIRDRFKDRKSAEEARLVIAKQGFGDAFVVGEVNGFIIPCLLYTSDAADERSSVDLGGRRIIKKKNRVTSAGRQISERHTKKV